MNSKFAMFSILTILLLTGVAGNILPVQSQLNSGDIIVNDQNAGTGGKGALFKIDSFTGERTLLSDFGVGANQGIDPIGVAVEALGNILVIDASAGTGGNGALFRVDPTTGERTLLSDFGVGANQFSNPRDLAVESSGSILVLSPSAGTGLSGALFRVDPVTGERTLLSDFGVGANQGVDPFGVTIEVSGKILVIDQDAGTGGNGALFRVDPISGVRTLLSDFGDGAPFGDDPTGVAVEASGNILVIDPDAGTSFNGALFRVDPLTGTRTLLSDFGLGANQGSDPGRLAIEVSGNILVTDQSAGTKGLLFRVDPITGARTVLCDFGVGANQGSLPFGVDIYPVIPAIIGGLVTPINKLKILTPYLALSGLLIALSTFYVFKRRKD